MATNIEKLKKLQDKVRQAKILRKQALGSSMVAQYQKKLEDAEKALRNFKPMKSAQKQTPAQRRKETLAKISKRKGTPSEAAALKKGKEAFNAAIKAGKTVAQAKTIGKKTAMAQMKTHRGRTEVESLWLALSFVPIAGQISRGLGAANLGAKGIQTAVKNEKALAGATAALAALQAKMGAGKVTQTMLNKLAAAQRRVTKLQNKVKGQRGGLKPFLAPVPRTARQTTARGVAGGAAVANLARQANDNRKKKPKPKPLVATQTAVPTSNRITNNTGGSAVKPSSIDYHDMNITDAPKNVKQTLWEYLTNPNMSPTTKKMVSAWKGGPDISIASDRSQYDYDTPEKKGGSIKKGMKKAKAKAKVKPKPKAKAKGKKRASLRGWGAAKRGY